MREEQQIIYMQARLVRLAAKEWNMPIAAVASLFAKFDVLQFVRECFGIFHVEGDYAVFDAVVTYLDSKGIKTNAETD